MGKSYRELLEAAVDDSGLEAAWNFEPAEVDLDAGLPCRRR
jgi:hypothetical protein